MKFLLSLALILFCFGLAQAQAPSAPTSLTVTPNAALSSSTVILQWTDNSTDETGFKIERKIGAGAFTEIAQTPANNSGAQVSFLDVTGGTAPLDAVAYRVRAFNGSGNSAYTNEPSAVTLRYRFATDIVTNGTTTITSSTINFSLTTGATIVLSGGTPATNLTTTIAFVNNAEPTTAVLAANPGTTATGVTASVYGLLPAAPTSVTATWTTTGIDLTWSHASVGVWTNGYFNNTLFQVWRSESSSGPFALIGGAQNNGTYKDRQWAFNKTYYYKVRGWHYFGVGVFSTVSSGASTPASAVTPAAVITANATGLVGEPIKFSGSASTYTADLPFCASGCGASGPVYPYTWDFGIGEDSGYNLRETAYAFRTAGTHIVTLTTKGQTGLSHFITLSVVVSDITVSGAASHVCTAGENGAVVSAVHNPTTHAFAQAALNATRGQDHALVELATVSDYISAAGTYLQLPALRTGAGYVTLRPIGYTTNFTNQKRVTASDISSLAKIALTASSTTDDIVISEAHATNPAHHYRLQGLQLKKTSATETQEIQAGIHFYASASSGTGQGIPHHIIQQHIYLDGDPVTSKWTYGIRADANYMSLLDSDIQHIKKTSNENYAVYANSTEGVHVFDNNKLYGFGMGIFYSGEDHGLGNPTLFARHVTIRRGFPTRRAADEANGSLAGHHWKNLIEFKRVEFLEVFGNMLGPCWNGDQDGTPILLTPVNQTGDANYSYVGQVQLKNNVIRNIKGLGASYIDFYAQDNGGFLDIDTTSFISITNNLFFDGVGGNKPKYAFQAQLARGEPVRYLVLDHNTLLNIEASIAIDNGAWIGTTEMAGNLIASNNLWETGYVVGTESGAFGKKALDQYFQVYTYMGNLVEGGVGGFGDFSSLDTSNKFPADIAAVGFTDYANRDLRLSGSSTYRAAGANPATDSTDRGANLTTIYNQLGSSSYAFGVGTTKAESGDWSGAAPPITAPIRVQGRFDVKGRATVRP